MKKNNQNVSNGMKFFIAAVSLVIIITITFLAGYTFGKGDKNLCKIFTKAGDKEIEVRYSLSDESFTVIGHIVQKNDDSIVINTRPESGFFEKEGTMNVEVPDIKINTDEQTKIVKTSSLINGDKDYENITLVDLQEFTLVQIFSIENIRDKDEFKASKINLLDQ